MPLVDDDNHRGVECPLNRCKGLYLQDNMHWFQGETCRDAAYVDNCESESCLPDCAYTAGNAASCTATMSADTTTPCVFTAGLDEGLLSFSIPILVYMDNPYRYNEYQ